jgi:hypothetical protein
MDFTGAMWGIALRATITVIFAVNQAVIHLK